jgi:hypothetical protein
MAAAQSGPRGRFWIETAAAFLSGLLAVVTVIWHDWIERVFGVEPDQGSGALEWLIVGMAFAISIGLALVARLEWRRPRGAEAAG